MRLGDIAEQRVMTLFDSLGWTSSKHYERETRSHFDLIVTIPWSGLGFTVEVKNDIYALKSGNIAVEMYNPKSGKLSGLTATKADLWVFMVGEELWIANTEKLRQYVDTHKPFRTIDAGGDKNANLFLYKKDVLFPDVFHRIDNITREELTEKISEIL